MTKSKFARIQRLLKALRKSGRDDVLAQAAALGLVFGMGWAQDVAAAGLTPEQLVQKLGGKLSADQQQALLGDVQNVLASPEVSKASADALAAKLVPLASEAGMSQEELTSMLKDAGFSDAQLTQLNPELEEEFIQARLNTPAAVQTANAAPGDPTDPALAQGEGVIPAAFSLGSAIGAGAAAGVVAGAAAGGGGDVPAAAGTTPTTPSTTVTITEQQAADLIDANQPFAASDTVTLQVDGTTVSDKGLSLAGLQALGVDFIVPDSTTDGQINIALGGGVSIDGFDSTVAPHFTDSADVTLGLSAAGTEFGNPSKLAGLQALGVDALALADGGTLGISTGEAVNVLNSGLVFSEDFVGFNGTSEVTTHTDVVLHSAGTSLVDSPLTIKSLALLGVDSIDTTSATGGKLTVAMGENDASQFNNLEVPHFENHVDATVSINDEFIASFSSKQAATSFFDGLNADHASIVVGTSSAELDDVLGKLENLNDAAKAFADMTPTELVTALQHSGVSEIVFEATNPLDDAPGDARLSALADAGLLRAETDKTLADVADLATNAQQAAAVDTLDVDNVRLVIDSGVDFSGDAAADAKALNDLLAKFDDNTDGVVESSEHLFAEGAKVTLAVDTENLALTADQLSDLINLGVDSLVNSDGVTVDIIGKTGPQTDIFHV